ncbi:MAG: MtrB/PioB family outer membrane beta-barrel protein [Acidobacteria bacterium]|nr:MtrB/PioB family outer membrane beta-barrel protein [Acidobacteriota bacterium]
MRTGSSLILPVVAVALALGLAPPAADGQTPASPPADPAQVAPSPPGLKWEGMFTFGTLATDGRNDLGRVGEFQVLRPGAVPSLAAEFWGGHSGFHFDVSARNSGDARAQRYLADIDFNRWVRAHVRYQRFPHRIEHDSLAYLDSASNINGTFVVTHEDTDPGARYQVNVGELDARVSTNLPAGVSFFVGHRQQMRDGARQSTTVNHCATCHVRGYTREVDETTRDLSAGAKIAMGAVSVDYTYTNRLFRSDAPTIITQYINGVHPATLQDIFLNRLWYEEEDGPLPMATVPGLRKDMHVVRANVALPRDAALSGQFTKSVSRNEDTRLEVDYTGGSGRLVVPIHPKLTLRADLRRYSIEADDVFIHVPEKPNPAGPIAGLTYEQAYPTVGELDWTRYSERSRTPTEMAVELNYRPRKKTSLRFGYEWERIDRPHGEIDQTTTNTVLVSGRAPLGRQAQYRFRVRNDWIDEPFRYVHAATPAVLQPFPSPGSPPSPLLGLQYYEFYRTRSTDLTSFPSRDLRFDQTVSWTPDERVAISASYRYRDSKNDELNYSDWTRSAHSPGVDLWFAGGERWTLSAGYQYQRERLETLFSTLAFVG